MPAQKSLQRKSKLKDCKTAKRKTGAEAEKNRTTEKGEFFRGTSATHIKKTLNKRLKGNCMEHAVKKIQIKKMIW